MSNRFGEIMTDIASVANDYAQESYWDYCPITGKKRQDVNELPQAIRYRAKVIQQRVEQLYDMAEELEPRPSLKEKVLNFFKK